MFFRILERGFVIVLFFFLMGAATSILYANEDSDVMLSAQGGLHGPIALIQGCLSLVAAFLILTRWRRVAGAALVAWPLLLLALLQLLSVTWSIDPLLTLRKTVFEFIMLSIGFYLGERYSTETIAKMLSEVLILAMGMIAVLRVVAPGFVTESGPHNPLKGLSQNKNGFGFYIGLTAALLLIIRFKRYDWLRYLSVPVAFAMLLLSRSMTSVASAAFIIMTLPLWLVFRLPRKHRAGGLFMLGTAVTVCGAMTLIYAKSLLALMGKDDTLTGRTAVWDQLLVAIGHRPLLGYGYGSFWTGFKGESLDVYVNAGWLAPSAHNAYLELWIALGIPGLVVAAFIFFSAFKKAIEYIRAEPGWAPLWPVAYIAFVLVHGLGESEFIYDASFACCLFTAMYTSLALRSARSRSGTIVVPVPQRSTTSHGLLTT